MPDHISMPPEGNLRVDRHIKYFLRCLKTVLPAAYTSTDANRMTLAFFILSGLDLLSSLSSKITVDERASYINWIYSCQLSEGGFRAFTGVDFSTGTGIARNENNSVWDPANLPGTFFALESLLILDDDLSRVRRRETLEWLARLQRADGSFGELLGVDGHIEGGRDLRYCCCAAGIRYILRGRAGMEGVRDVDVEGLVRYTESCQVCVYYDPE